MPLEVSLHLVMDSPGALAYKLKARSKSSYIAVKQEFYS